MNRENMIQSFKNTLDFDFAGTVILIAMALKTFGLIPLIVRIDKTKSAEDVSFATPIMFLIAFVMLGVISLLKGYYLPICLFCVGIIVCIILIVKIGKYEKNKADKNKNIKKINKKIEDYPTKFPFPSPQISENYE